LGFAQKSIVPLAFYQFVAVFFEDVEPLNNMVDNYVKAYGIGMGQRSRSLSPLK